MKTLKQYGQLGARLGQLSASASLGEVSTKDFHAAITAIEKESEGRGKQLIAFVKAEYKLCAQIANIKAQLAAANAQIAQVYDRIH